jgi:hypothetical protein
MQPRDRKTGKFGQIGAEPKGQPIALRLPQSLDERLRQTVPADEIKEWIQAAIAEKLDQVLGQKK